MSRSRRLFLLGAAAFGGGFAVGYWLRRQGAYPPSGLSALGQHSFNAYIAIGEDGRVTVAVPRAEMGQGVQTALAMLVADTLDVEVKDISVEHPLPSKHYINRELLGSGLWFVLPQDQGRWAQSWRAVARSASGFFDIMQLTGGSTSLRDAWEPMGAAGATARAILMQAAADLWHADARGLQTEKGKVLDPRSKRVLAYGDLASRAKDLPVNRGIPPKLAGRKAYPFADRMTARLDTAAKVNGTAIFGIDVKHDGMLYAAVRSAPTLAGRIASFDQTAAASEQGVSKILRVDERTVAVVADSYWTAQRAADRLPLTCADQNDWLSSEAITADFGRRMAAERAHVFRNKGDAPAQLEPPRKVVEAEYSAPYLAHACMEPLNCTAAAGDDKCELWLGTQAPALVVDAVARALDMRPGAVTVHTTLLGGGFGRRLEVDVAMQAAKIAKEFPGKAVKLIWSREEDIRRKVFRPAARARLVGALDQDRMPQALTARICSQSVMRDFLKRNSGAPFPLPDKTNAEGLFDQPYNIPHFRVEHVEAENEVPVGNWRAVGHGFNGFAMESFLDELAHEGRKDPFDVRRHLLDGFEGKQALLDRLRELSGWNDKKPAGVDGRGLAYRRNFESDVAQVIDIALVGNQVRVKHVFCVIDCGEPIDPRGIRAQVESAIVFGLSAALMQAITIRDGRVQQANFHQFDALRINQCPKISIDIVRHHEGIGGVGETAVPPVAPALANAIFAATGRRIRELPLNASVGVA
jgi:isoquinoline 1-oxidoreductase beta subunit